MYTQFKYVLYECINSNKKNLQKYINCIVSFLIGSQPAPLNIYSLNSSNMLSGKQQLVQYVFKLTEKNNYNEFRSRIVLNQTAGFTVPWIMGLREGRSISHPARGSHLFGHDPTNLYCSIPARQSMEAV